ncbi:pol-related protein [Clonorchis sinensis]|uniref:Pol-related protein n=1 Tax=Clonorchis sinensis TaxID=79923 RepID=G7YTV7_CLOSI|nr:pol-related protein [Clonorchis sinensis]
MTMRTLTLVFSDLVRTPEDKDHSTALSFSLHREKSSQKMVAALWMTSGTFSRFTRMDFQMLRGAYVRSVLEYADQVLYSLRKKDVTLTERVQRAARKSIAGLKSEDYETSVAVVELFPLEYRRFR